MESATQFDKLTCHTAVRDIPSMFDASERLLKNLKLQGSIEACCNSAERRISRNTSCELIKSKVHTD